MSEPEVVEKTEVSQKIEEPVITKKDPKKVEQGKRLAAISKEAKEKKMRERIREEEFSYLPWIGYAVSVVSSLGLLYFVVFSHSDKIESDIHPMTIIREHEVPPTPQNSPTPPKKKNFESLK